MTTDMREVCRDLIGRWVQTYPARPHEAVVCIADVRDCGEDALVLFDTLVGTRSAWLVSALRNVSEVPQEQAAICERQRAKALSARREEVWQ